MPHFVCPFICQWTFEMFSPLAVVNGAAVNIVCTHSHFCWVELLGPMVSMSNSYFLSKEPLFVFLPWNLCKCSCFYLSVCYLFIPKLEDGLHDVESLLGLVDPKTLAVRLLQARGAGLKFCFSTWQLWSQAAYTTFVPLSLRL